MFKRVLVLVLGLSLVCNLAYALSSTSCFDTDTKLMLHFNGTDASTTITDSSSVPKTATAVGNAQLDTAQVKFSTASLLMDGTGDYVSVLDDADWNFGSGDFTIDLWVQFNSVVATNFYSQFVDSNNRIAFRRTGGGALQFFFISGGTTLANYTVTWSPSTGQWYHLAVVRNGTNLFMFIDGVSQSLTVLTAISTNAVPDLAAPITMGSADGGIVEMNGWFDEYRVVKGTAVWTATFTPPSAEYSSTCRRRVTPICISE